MQTSPMKISTRLTLSFGATIAMGVGIAIYGAVAMQSMSTGVNELANNRMIKVAQFSEMKDNQNAIARHARNILISDDSAFRNEQIKKIAEMRSINKELRAKLDKSIVLPKGRELYKVILDTVPDYNATIDRAIELAVKGDKAAAGALLLGESRDLQNRLFKATDESRDLQQEIAEGLGQKAEATAALGLTLMSGLALLMLAIGAGVSWLITRNIKRALGAEPAELSVAVGHIADGDLSQPLASEAGDTGSVLANLVRMQGSLSKVVSTVRQNSESVATASAQIAQGNNDLSQRTEEQASSLEETAASMEELGSTVRQNADNARQANQLALSASSVAIKGGEVVSQVVQTMRGINDSSKKIADIISVIDGIAFQTNILALNAAVEAARAGEQGRGFAVVASEVRSLAGRSADAAKEIKSLITASVERVEQGTLLVDQAGATMTEVVGSIKRVTDIMGEISSASSEQSAGVSQVGEAVSQMDQVTQQNAALVEESAAAAESLKTQALQLVQVVAVFKLGEGDHARAGLAHTSPAPAAAERRSEGRAKNVARAPFGKAKPAARPVNTGAPATAAEARTGTDDWASF